MPRAIITGASKGIGKAIAIELAKTKYDLVLVARSAALLQDLAKDLAKQYGVKVSYLAIDLGKTNAAQEVFDWVKTNDYQINVLVNNAGYGLSGSFEENSIESHRDMMQLNMISLTEMCQVFLPMLKAQSKAYIMNIASTTAYQALPMMSVYAASKAFVLSFSRGLSHELRKTGVSVTAISPGATDTGFNDRANINQSARKAAEKVAMTPEAVAKIAVLAMFARDKEVITGIINKVQAFASWLLPKRLIETVASGIYEQ
jgi:uncharacterized protein